MENRSFYIRYEKYQPVKINTHIGAGRKIREYPLIDVADLIEAYKYAVAPRFDNTPGDEITLYQVVDGDVESEALLPDIPLTEIHGGQSARDPLIIQTLHETDSPTRLSFSVEKDAILLTKRKLANDFIESIRKKFKPIPDSDGMFVSSNIMFLEGESTRPLVIRKITHPFWNSVIEKLDEQVDGRHKYRVCVVGSPGIGKTTTTTPYLIRMLLEKEKTVVYLIRRPQGRGYYYEFTPVKNSNSTKNNINMNNVHNNTMDDMNVDMTVNVTVNVFIESDWINISSLSSTETYYIVDPGVTKDTCDPGPGFAPKLIIVASPDNCHWGMSEFDKTREFFQGIFMYMPVWGLHELLCAALTLCIGDPELVEIQLDREKLNQEIIDRYRLFGGVPRHIFDTQIARHKVLLKQDQAIGVLTKDQVKILFAKNPQSINNFQSNQPQGLLMHYTSSSDTSSFDKPKTAVSSSLAYEKICFRFMLSLWNDMLDDSSGIMLESYLRHLLCQPEKLICFQNRPCVGQSHDSYKLGHAELSLGGCNKIRCVRDPISSAIENPMVVFYSYNRFLPLFDLCYYENEKRCLVLVQATTSASHDAKKDSFNNLKIKVDMINAANASSDQVHVMLCYAVPSSQYSTFVTNPVDPIAGTDLPFDIRHINVMKPAAEFL
jgi:Retrotransposon hot spot protein